MHLLRFIYPIDVIAIYFLLRESRSWPISYSQLMAYTASLFLSPTPIFSKCQNSSPPKTMTAATVPITSSNQNHLLIITHIALLCPPPLRLLLRIQTSITLAKIQRRLNLWQRARGPVHQPVAQFTSSSPCLSRMSTTMSTIW